MCPQQAYISTVPSHKPERQYKPGDPVTVSLFAGRVIDGVVKTIVNRTDGVRLQVDFGKDETALVSVAGPRGGCVAQ